MKCAVIFSMNKRCAHTNVCIIGGGLSGMAAAAYMSEHGNVNITVMDRARPGLSSVEAGLLHPFTPKGKLIWRGVEGMELTLNLLQRAASKGYNALRGDIKIIRPFVTHEKLNHYIQIAEKYPDFVQIIEQTEYSRLIPQSNQSIAGAALLKRSSVVDVRIYLQGLWAYVQDSAANATWLIEQKDIPIEELKHRFDVVVVAAGPSSPLIWRNGTAGLKFSMTRGRIFLCDELFPNDGFDRLSYAILAGEYVFPHPSRDGVIVCGASKENISAAEEMEVDVDCDMDDDKWASFRDKLIAIYPAAGHVVSPISSWLGYRVYIDRGAGRPKLPVVCKHDTIENTWLITGFGSRGLIHHALAARHLVSAITNKKNTPTMINTNCIPKELEINY